MSCCRPHPPLVFGCILSSLRGFNPQGWIPTGKVPFSSCPGSEIPLGPFFCIDSLFSLMTPSWDAPPMFRPSLNPLGFNTALVQHTCRHLSVTWAPPLRLNSPLALTFSLLHLCSDIFP